MNEYYCSEESRKLPLTHWPSLEIHVNMDREGLKSDTYINIETIKSLFSAASQATGQNELIAQRFF
jgi:hypothetical protein